MRMSERRTKLLEKNKQKFNSSITHTWIFLAGLGGGSSLVKKETLVLYINVKGFRFLTIRMTSMRIVAPKLNITLIYYNQQTEQKTYEIVQVVKNTSLMKIHQVFG